MLFTLWFLPLKCHQYDDKPLTNFANNTQKNITHIKAFFFKQFSLAYVHSLVVKNISISSYSV